MTFSAAVGCDGTPVNTGYRNGVIRKMEEKLGRSLHWFVCQIHANELLLRHLFQHYDGPTTGPKTNAGPLSKAIANCDTLPIVKFQSVDMSADLSNIDAKKLSKDQQYLLEISRAVTKGKVSEDLTNRNPGPISHARWLTTANRILRCYVATAKPNNSLLNLVYLVMKVYVPVWFSIRKNPKCFDGPRNLLQTVVLSRCLTDEVRKVIDPVIQRNAFYGHPENILLAMVVDARLEIRVDAMNKIMKIRQKKTKEKTNDPKIRVFAIPTINFEAKEYTDLIQWDSVTEPPLLKSFEEDELKDLMMTNSVKLKQILDFPCHSQAVERHVKLVTEASKTVCGYESRQVRILGGIKSRSIIPSFHTKKDFVVPNEEKE